MELIEIKVIYLFDAEQPFHNEPNVSVITDIIGLWLKYQGFKWWNPQLRCSKAQGPT